MTCLENIKQEIAQAVNQALGQDLVSPEQLSYPPDSSLGDLTLPCFALAKELKKTPVVLAKELAAKLPGSQAAGPYLNFKVNKSKLAQDLLPAIDSDYGTNQNGAGQKVMVEFSNVNTHKEYHIGHVRNIAFGDAVDRLLLSNGYDAIPVTYVNDFGIHVAKTLWWANHSDNPQNIKNKGNYDLRGKDAGYYLGQMYVDSNVEMANRPEAKDEIASVMKDIESRQGEYYKLWQETREWSLDYFQSIYARLQVKFERSYYESDYLEAGLKLVQEMLDKGILIKSQGAVIADLAPYDLGVLVVIRSDGTALYPVSDLALAVAKFKENIKQSIYIVDNRQGFYFQQLFKVLELLGYQQAMLHLSYDFVKLPSGLMSSRSGNTVTFEELYEELMSTLIQEIKSRHEDWPEDKITETAQIMAVGVLKFEMLKVSPNKIITFDVKEALRFDGFTSVYLQYTVARINSIARQADLKSQPGMAVDALVEPLEQEMLWALAKYPERVAAAGQSYEPSEIAKYLFDLARLFNDYYHQVPVLKAPAKTKQARLALLAAVRQVLQNGLDLLGIAIVEQM